MEFLSLVPYTYIVNCKMIEFSKFFEISSVMFFKVKINNNIDNTHSVTEKCVRLFYIYWHVYYLSHHNISLSFLKNC